MQYVKHSLLFTTLCLLLSMAHVVTPELSSGETIIQWVWFGKVLPFTAGSIIAVLFWAWIMGKLRWSPLKVILFDSILGAAALALVIIALPLGLPGQTCYNDSIEEYAPLPGLLLQIQQ